MATEHVGTAQLDAMREASAALTRELDLNAVLQTVVDRSRSLVNARYAALGVLNAEGTEIEQFITAGIPVEQRAHIGPFPRGHGLLGAIIQEGRTIRVDDIAADRRSSPGPNHHPHMTTFLGVPIVSKGRVLGNLYLTDKVARGEGRRAPIQYLPFTGEDEETLELFAMQAAIAIENALLHRRSEQLAIAKERERFAMDLHDGIIQSIYAVGLTLDDGRFYLEKDPAHTKARIDQAIDDLDGVIDDLRAYIMELEPERFRERDLVTGLAELARELRASSFLKVEIEGKGVIEVEPEQTREVLHIAKEALVNARKHARATSVQVNLRRMGDQLVLFIRDDGVGIEAAAPSTSAGNGLPNMTERACKLGGRLEIESQTGVGTTVTVTWPTA